MILRTAAVLLCLAFILAAGCKDQPASTAKGVTESGKQSTEKPKDTPAKVSID